MKFTILSLFPEMFSGPLNESIVKRAQEKGLLDIEIINFRDFAIDKHKTAAPASDSRRRFGRVDDTPYGGGPGMLLKVDVIDRALQSVISVPSVVIPAKAGIQKNKKLDPRVKPKDDKKNRIILLTPQGEKFTQKKAIELSKYDNLILICGHYEGFDERIREHLVDEGLSIGDYILTGGELPAMVVVDAVSRMIPGVIKEESRQTESFMSSTQDSKLKTQDFDYPQYTRPEEYKGWKVPEVLLSGDHKKITDWREKKAAR